MAYLLLEDFKFGLDSRRFKLNAPPGTLTVLTNGHITPGGEIEKRKAFENFYLPPDTFGLEVTSAGFEVYGSKAQSALTAGTQVATTKRSRSSNVATLTFAADPNIAVGDIVTITSAGGTGYNASQVTVTAASAAAPWTISYANTGSNEAETTDTAGRVAPVLPVNVTYVRLQHPDDANAVMTQVIHSTVYNGAAFVIADYGADGIVSFYDETAVDDLSPGRLANILADADALATYIAAQLDATDTYAASASAGTVTVTGPTGQTFSVEYGPLGSNGAYESPCTTPLDTTPPDVEGVAISELEFVTISYDGYTASYPLTPSLAGFEYGTPGGYTNEASNGTTDSGIEYYAGGGPSGYADLGNIAPVSPNLLYGGAARTLTIYLPYWGAPDPNATSGVFEVRITYANTATKTIRVTWDGDGGPETVGPFTLDADPPEVTPTITTSVISDGVQPVSGTIPQTQFTVIAVNASGSGIVTDITIDGTGILNSAGVGLARSGTNYDTPALLATALKNQINTYCTAQNLDFSATVSNNIVVIRATDPTSYAALSGATVVVTVDDDVCIGNGAVRFSRASAVNTPTWTAILVDGADVLGSTVPAGAWVDMATAVAEVATTINAFSSAYTAVADGSTLYVSKLATSSTDRAVQISPAGTDLNWEGVNPGGGNTGVSGGTFPGTIDVSPVDAALRKLSSSAASAYTGDIAVTVGGGQPPYIYQWETVSGGELEYTVSRYNTVVLPIFTSPVAPTTKVRLDNMSLVYNAGRSVTSVTKYGAAVRCKITDSLNRIGYGPTINVHYP